MVNIDIRIKQTEPLVSPEVVRDKYPLTSGMVDFIVSSRSTVNDIIKGKDKRLLAVVGPCSIHDPEAALDYAGKLKVLAEKVSDKLFVVMRTYFEKPRTVLGWKGLIMDPKMDGSYDIAHGILLARSLLVKLTTLGLPLGCEVLDPIIPQYIDELMSWSSIGARTTESQTHRNLASGLSVAVGFKNNTNGDVASAVNAIKCALSPASFIGIDKNGMSTIFRTTGNDCCHLILRGGDQSPNYYEDDVEAARKMMEEAGLNPAIVIDCSHGNSRKDYRRQSRVLRSLVDQVCWGEKSIRGFMLESNIKAGKQALSDNPASLEYGKSVTDGCMGWEETESLLLATAQRLRSGVSSPL
jgi:3-deoxy-7-phosphoheptulonate synthase